LSKNVATKHEPENNVAAGIIGYAAGFVIGFLLVSFLF
jgi:hypothetical protein